MVGLVSVAATLEMVGGDLSLDFANTVGNHRDKQPSEHLHDYTDLLAWSCHAGIIDDKTARILSGIAERSDKAAHDVLDRGIALREAIYRIFTDYTTGKKPRAQDLEILNENLGRAMGQARIVLDNERFAWDWGNDRAALDQMLWPIARSAAGLLTSSRLELVNQCGGDTCGWLFVDSSKNHSRRWCSMSDCGNRAKARRHLERVRASK